MGSIDYMMTLSEIIKVLRTKGYTEDFEMTAEGFTAKKANIKLSPEDIRIRRTYRFEGESNPADNSILYAMETRNNIKGILIEAYGIYGGNESENLTEFMKKVKKEEKTF